MKDIDAFIKMQNESSPRDFQDTSNATIIVEWYDPTSTCSQSGKLSPK